MLIVACNFVIQFFKWCCNAVFSARNAVFSARNAVFSARNAVFSAFAFRNVSSSSSNDNPSCISGSRINFVRFDLGRLIVLLLNVIRV